MTTRHLSATLLVLAVLVGACASADDATLEATTAATTADVPATPAASAAEVADTPAPASDPVDPEPVDATDAATGGRVEYVDAEQGGENVVLEGTLGAEPDVFIVPIPSCCTGETFGVTVSSPDGAVTAEIVDPSGEAFVSEQTDTDIEPDETGEWTIVLTGPPGSSYVLEIGLGVNAS